MPTEFRVLDPRAPREVTDRDIQRIANAIRDEVTARTPRRTGRLAAGWQVSRVRPGTWRVSNEVPYGRFVEYGTRHQPARPFLGPVIARWRHR